MDRFDKITEKDLKQVAEGKTKIIYEIHGDPLHVLVRSKDKITAFNNVRADNLEGKAKLSNFTNGTVFKFLNNIGLKTHFIRQQNDTDFIAERCAMIPIEWVARRIATGSYLKRNPGVKEGFRFNPPKLEIFYKDDAAGDPIWSEEMLIESGMVCGGVHVGMREAELMFRVTQTVFEVLEKAWARLGCTLVDMKIEFGVNGAGEIVLADVIDSDSWRLWPAGDRRLQLDKQFYRDLKEVTPEALDQLKKNFAHVVEMLQKFETDPVGRAVVLLGSDSDLAHGEKIREACMKLGIPTLIRITSAHKGTQSTLNVVAQYEGDNIPTVFIAVAGRSNGLGPVTSGNTCYPVINCPPITAEWASQDIWSSLHVPSGLGCATVMSPDAAAFCAANILSLSDHMVWCRLRIKLLVNNVNLMRADKKVTKEKCTMLKNGTAKEEITNGVHVK